MNDDWLIYPLTRQGVALLARAGSAAFLLCLTLRLLTLAASIFLPQGTFSLRLAALLLQAGAWGWGIGLCCCGLLAPWCHDVLLAKRGSKATRFLSRLALIFALFLLFCASYTLATDRLLLIRQEEIPLWLSCLLLTILLCNLPNMAAAPLRWQILLVLFPLLSLACPLTGMTGSLPWDLLSQAFGLCSCLIGSILLTRLSRLAPHLAGLPEK